MSPPRKFPFTRAARLLCRALRIAPERVLRRVGLPGDFLVREGDGTGAGVVFSFWNAALAEARQPDLPLTLGRNLARGPFNSAIFAFSCSPNVEIGLRRLALFKPLIGPIRLEVERQSNGLAVVFLSADPSTPLPHSLAEFELVYFLELVRCLTAEHVVPRAVTLPGRTVDAALMDEHFGTASQLAERPRIILGSEDAERPLISQAEELWEGFEAGLRWRLNDREPHESIGTRVKGALLELLPTGQSTAEAVCKRLMISKRSLFRYLKDEGLSYQSVLNATRSELSRHYLSNTDISIDEISYLLAFKDPNSFYRAFRGWTGRTPMEIRRQSLYG